MRKKIGSKETPKERFRRLATLRTQAVLKRLQILGNCANRYVYDYDESDIDKIFLELERCVREVKAKYRQPKKGSEFKL
ncbi:MAG: hypothetical protein NTV42_09670 [Chloroflexi bacterium]|nr:hypothetical protein [Chloroflexota bacterium]